MGSQGILHNFYLYHKSSLKKVLEKRQENGPEGRNKKSDRREKESVIGKRNPETPVNHLGLALDTNPYLNPESPVNHLGLALDIYPYLTKNKQTVLTAPVVPKTRRAFNFCIRNTPLREE